MMSKKFSETFEVRLMPGCTGEDADASEWEVLEVRGEDSETACDNLTLAEANQIAGMWTKKKEEAEAEASRE
jgi:hypothetical protein